jgi:hypothetical protein
VANQINRARKVAERLGKRHGVSCQVAQLTLNQQGPGAFTDAAIATLLMAEGVYLLALFAEYPSVVPASSPKAARAIARRMTRHLRSPDAERPSIFLAHAILRYGTFGYRELANDSMASALASGSELLAAHYPMPAADVEQLDGCSTAFAPLLPGAAPPAYRAPLTFPWVG